MEIHDWTTRVFTLFEIAWTFYMLHGNKLVNFSQNMENPERIMDEWYMDKFCMITMQRPLFQLKLKTRNCRQI